MEDQLEQAVTIAIQGTGDDALKQQVRTLTYYDLHVPYSNLSRLLTSATI